MIEQFRNCDFCEIVENRAESFVITRTDKSIAIISLEGHPLVFPLRHVNETNINENLTEMIASYTLANQLIPAVKRAYAAVAINLLENRGECAGQRMDHFHIHILPRESGDKLLTVKRQIALGSPEKQEILNRVIDEL